MMSSQRARAQGRALRLLSVVLAASASGAARLSGQPVPAPQTNEPFVVEYYYKARWGFADEFLALFRKNHLPVLELEIEKGRMLEVSIARPRYHGTEEGRWDYRVTIVYPSVAAAHAPSAASAAELRRLFPDSAAFAREERRRFEILEAHWDLPIVPVPRRP